MKYTHKPKPAEITPQNFGKNNQVIPAVLSITTYHLWSLNHYSPLASSQPAASLSPWVGLFD